MGRTQARKLGFATLPLVEIAHPFGLRSRAEVRVLAEGCVDTIARLAQTKAPE